MLSLIKWFRKFSNKSIHSIAFFPAMIAVLFLLLVAGMYQVENSSGANFIKQRWVWLNLRNIEAARTIISTIATSIIGLTVFSFSMVMVVMSQAASQMSNRILDNLIGNRFQQVTLGFYIGTTISSFFLLTVVDDRGTNQVPSLSVFLLVLLTIADLFLFVSFLHFITQSVRFENLIRSLHDKTISSMKDFPNGGDNCEWGAKGRATEIASPVSKYFQGFNRRQLLKVAERHDLRIQFLSYPATYMIRGEALMILYSDKEVGENITDEIFECVDFYTGQEIDKNPYYGFLHLTEVALKALSPSLNDPNTAVLAIHALTDLLTSRMEKCYASTYVDRKNVCRVLIPERSFDDLFQKCIYPIWDYGKKDRFMQEAMKRMLVQLRFADKEREHGEVFSAFEREMQG